jgi:hypothetical protein
MDLGFKAMGPTLYFSIGAAELYPLGKALSRACLVQACETQGRHWWTFTFPRFSAYPPKASPNKFKL